MKHMCIVLHHFAVPVAFKFSLYNILQCLTIFLPKVRWRMQARWVAMHASRMKGVQVEVKQLDDMEKAGMVGRVKIVENDLHQIKTSVQS